MPIFHALGFEIDCELVAFDFFRAAHDFRNLRVAETNRQQTIFQAVIGEDVGERRGEHDAEPEIGERPDGVLAGRSAGKILARHEDSRALIARIVKNKVSDLLPVAREAPVIKQKLPEAGALDALEELGTSSAKPSLSPSMSSRD